MRSHNSRRREPVLSSFHLWPPWLFYLPVFGYWLWLSIRHRSLTLPTAANPSIYSGGFIGESKSQILVLVAPRYRELVAPWIIVEVPESLSPQELVVEAEEMMAASGLSYPLIAKPDVGRRGDGVCPVYDGAELAAYLSSFPTGQDVILQRMAATPLPKMPVTGGSAPLADAREAGILYWRHPDRERGTIFSLTLKFFPEVVGDGERTLRQLVKGDEYAHRFHAVFLERSGSDADRILAAGERRSLVTAGNHRQGAIFRDGTHLATPELRETIDAVARSMPGFYFGSFDIQFSDLDRFLRGEDMTIIEINGASAEGTHIWDRTIGIRDAYRSLFIQFRTLFEIGAANRTRGYKPLGVVRMLRDATAYRRIARRYPDSR